MTNREPVYKGSLFLFDFESNKGEEKDSESGINKMVNVKANKKRSDFYEKVIQSSPIISNCLHCTSL